MQPTDPPTAVACPQCGTLHTPHPATGPYCSPLCLSLHTVTSGKPKPEPKPKRRPHA